MVTRISEIYIALIFFTHHQKFGLYLPFTGEGCQYDDKILVGSSLSFGFLLLQQWGSLQTISTALYV